jgi:hypothetical protein
VLEQLHYIQTLDLDDPVKSHRDPPQSFPNLSWLRAGNPSYPLLPWRSGRGAELEHPCVDSLASHLFSSSFDISHDRRTLMTEFA